MCVRAVGERVGGINEGIRGVRSVCVGVCVCRWVAVRE